MRHVVLILVLTLGGAVGLAQSGKPISAKSPTCKEVVGKTQKDIDRALAFCTAAVPKDLGIQAVMADETIIWVQVPRLLADAMRRDSLSTEQLVKNWMRAWKTQSGSTVVTVYVEWRDVEIAKGETTLLSGDKVTVRK